MRGVLDVVVVELVKTATQWRVRLAVVAIVLGPLLVALVLQAQAGLPTDALYGRWVKETGLALPLVVLSAAGPALVALLSCLVAGDAVSGEHSAGTWPLLLTRSRSAVQLLTGKAVAAAAWACGLVALLAASCVLAGLLVSGTDDLVGLTGQTVPFRHALVLVVLAWAGCLPVALALTALALLVSSATRSSVVGVVAPVALAEVLHLVSLLAPLGAVRPLLLVPGLQAWHGLLLARPTATPLLQSCAVAAGWTILSALATAFVVRRRDLAVP